MSVPQTGNGLSNGTFGGPNRVQQTPQRQPLANVGTGSMGRPIISGYGMSAGLRVGRQQGKRVCIAIQGMFIFVHTLAASRAGDFMSHGQDRSRLHQVPPVSQSQQMPANGGVYY